MKRNYLKLFLASLLVFSISLVGVNAYTDYDYYYSCIDKCKTSDQIWGECTTQCASDSQRPGEPPQPLTQETESGGKQVASGYSQEEILEELRKGQKDYDIRRECYAACEWQYKYSWGGCNIQCDNDIQEANKIYLRELEAQEKAKPTIVEEVGTGLSESVISTGAVIGDYMGDVKVYRAGKEIPVIKYLSFKQGDTITTGSNGKVKIIFNDGSWTELSPKTSFTFEEPRPLETTFKLDFGTIRAWFKRALNREFHIRTGNAYVIRGTEFVLSSDPDKETDELHLYEGSIEMTLGATGEKKMINSGESATLDSEGISINPLTQEKWDSLVKEISIPEGKVISYWVWILIGLAAAVIAAYYFFGMKKRKKK